LPVIGAAMTVRVVTVVVPLNAPLGRTKPAPEPVVAPCPSKLAGQKAVGSSTVSVPLHRSVPAEAVAV
jgi:hypothetical protein